MLRSEHLKLTRAWDSLVLIRPGYWQCHKCTAHNFTSFPFCVVCLSDHWRLRVPTELVSLGPPTTLLQNVVYALPAVKCKLFVTGAPTLQKSNTVDFAANVAVVLVDGEAEVSGGFIRSTGGNVVVTFKRA